MRKINDNLAEIARTLLEDFYKNNESDLITEKVKNIAIINDETFKKSDIPLHLKYLDTANMTKNRIEKIVEFNTNIESIPSRARRKVNPLDIVYSTVRPNQYHYGIIETPSQNLVVSTGFATISANFDLINPYHLYLFLSDEKIVQHLQSIAENSTSTYPSIKPSDIGDLGIALSKFKNKNIEFGYKLNPLFKKIDKNNDKIKYLTILRDLLLPKLLSREITL